MKKLDSADLAAMFGIELDSATIVPSVEIAKVLCTKCNGRGNFIGYTGRVVGKCFACDGTGLDRTIGVQVKEGDCVKCNGTGEYSAGRPCFACNSTGKTLIGADIDVSAISTAFAAAYANKIKSPKLRLDSFVFSRAPDTGRNAGSIYVKNAGEYIGKVTAGKFIPSLACDDGTKARVVAVASDPHNAAKAYGAKTGSCSCCGRELTNGESVELGIGPICRDKYGWG